MRSLADRGVVHVQIAADRPHHDLPGVQADTNLDETSLGLPNSLRVALDRFLHSERCITSPYRMVLMSDGRPEERHNPITHHLVDRALVAVDRLHHEFEHRVQDLARLLGVPVGEQLHGALYVGEEHGDLLALAFQGGPGGEDFLGQVLRGVGLGRGEARLPGRLTAYGSTALVAEPGSDRYV